MESLRRKTNKIVLGFVFIVIVVSFVFWGVGDIEVSAPGSLTSVNGEEIPYEDFQWQYRIQYDFMDRVRGGRKALSEDDIKRLEASVASSLVAQTAMGQRAQSLGFRINDDEILDQLKETKVFNDPEKNRFSPSMYARVLEANGITKSQYERTLRRELLGSRLRDLLEMSIIISDAELADVQRSENTRFNLETASWDSKALVASGALKPTDSALKDFYEKHKGEFLTSAQRSVLIAELSPIAVERSIQISPEETTSFYETKVKSSTDDTWKTAQAHAYHILISDTSGAGLKRANEIASRIKSSKDVFAAFRQVAAEVSEDFSNSPLGGDLGYFNEKAMVKPFASAVFGGKLNTVLGPIKTDFGYHLIFVIDRTSASPELENRQKQIAYEIRRSKLEARIKEIESSLADTVKSGKKDLKEELQGLGFKISQPMVVDAVRRTEGVPFLLNQRIFEAPLNQWSEPMLAQGSLYSVFTQSEIAPQPMSFDQARVQVRAKWESRETEAFVRNQVEGLKAKKIKWSDLARSGATLKTQKDFKPFSAFEVPGMGGSEGALRAAQGLSEQTSIAGPLVHEGRWFLLRGENFRSDALKPLTAEELAKQKQNLRDERKALILDAYLQSLVKTSRIPADFKAKYQF